MDDTQNASNELDEYGVWVKTPPHVAQDGTPPQSSEAGAEDLSALPDFSFLDSIAAASQEEPNSTEVVPEKTGVENESISFEDFIAEDENQVSPEKVQNESEEVSSIEEEISLDDFLSDDSSSSNENKNASVDNLPDGEVSLDSFFDTSDSASDNFTPDGEISLDEFFDSESSEQTKTPEPEENYDDPLDIDLSFDDDLEVVEEDNTESGTSVFFDEPKDSVEAESVDLSDFLSDDFPSEPSSPEGEAQNQQVSSSGEEESIDLSEFGIEEEPAPNKKNENAKTVQDYDLTVSVDDDAQTQDAEQNNDDVEDESVSLELSEHSEKTEESHSPEKSVDTSDFNVDDLLSSIEDENGGTTSLVNTESNFEQTFSDKIDDKIDDFGDSKQEIVAKNEKEVDNSSNDLSEKDESIVGISPAGFTEDTASEQPEPIENGIEMTAEELDAYSETTEPIINSTETTGETQMNNTAELANETNSLLQQIAQELSSLKTEINTLKSEFAEFKKGTPVTESPVVQEEVQESSGGFFGDLDDDDTIALSGDEMSNILNSAEFISEDAEALQAQEEDFAPTEQEVQEQDSQADSFTSLENEESTTEETSSEITEDAVFETPAESAETSSETPIENAETESFETEESVISEESQEETPSFEEEVETSEESDDEFISEEISVPKIEDFEEPVVSEQLEETAEETETVAEESSSDKAETENAEEDVVPPTVDDVIATVKEDERFKEDFVPTVSSEESEYEYSPLDEPLAPEETESAADEKLRFDSENAEATTEETVSEENEVSEDSSFEEVSSSDAEADESLEEGIEDEPVEQVFDQWSSSSDSSSEIVEEGAVFDAIPDVSDADFTSTSESEANFTESVEEPVVSDSVQEEPESAEETIATNSVDSIPSDMKEEIKSVLSYMDQLLENLPEEKIAEFAKSEQFATYKKLFAELGLS